MVELVDGSVLAQLAVADMRLPIEVALAYPKRGRRIVEPLDLSKIGMLSFEKPDEEVFISLRLAREAMKRGGLFPAALNAANEWCRSRLSGGPYRIYDHLSMDRAGNGMGGTAWL